MQRWAWALIAGACLIFGSSADAQTWTAGQEFDDCGGADWCPRMIVLPAGNFQMGSPDSETGRDKDEGPQHRVWLHAFAVGKFEVTFAQWDACVADGACEAVDDAGWGRDARPVINVNWRDMQTYLAWLSQRTGRQYRLLSESEWEYAARAGRSNVPFGTGQNLRPREANYAGSHIDRTQAVGSYAANHYGLYDMQGNVWEVVDDCFTRRYWTAPTDGSPHVHDDSCYYGMARGGAWNESVTHLRSANRNKIVRTQRSSAIGFRVARSLD